MMPVRSFLFTPGDSQKKIDKGSAGTADALILDLEDSVAEQNKPAARILVRNFLQGTKKRPDQQLWVRINPLDTPHALKDLATVVAAQPHGLMLPKVTYAGDVTTLSNHLDALEVAFDVPVGSIKILPVVTETAGALFKLGGYRQSSSRLYALTWGAEDLAAVLGASSNRDDSGRLTFTYQLARSLCLAGAAAADSIAIETIFPDFRDQDGLRAYATASRRDGFKGMMAIHPDQVDVINEAFTPSEEEVVWAKRVVRAFAESSIGAAGIDGKMLDMPHLKQAKQLLGIS